jgi:arylsulfatase A-like enzyme
MAARRPPNIIFVLADDLGWAELGCYGNTFNRTPNLDRLARQGVRFTHAYTPAPVCSPTRAGLMTGQHPARVGILDYLRADDPNHLSPALPALPKMLHQAGYQNCLVGKWHLMGDYATRPGDPSRHGFDQVRCSESSYIGPGDYFHPYNHMKEVPARRENEYLTDRLYDEALEFIEGARKEPFFLYLAHYAPHTRLAAKPDAGSWYTTHPHAGKNRNNPELASMLDAIDEGIGRITKQLDELGLASNTLLVFNSDNGGELNVTSNAPLRGGKSQLYEGGIRVPSVWRLPGVTRLGASCGAPVNTLDYYPTLLELAGVKPPAGHVLDGLSITRWLGETGATPPRRGLYWHYPLEKPHFLGGRSAGAIQRDGWKLIEFFDDQHKELYHLASDPSETKDVAASEGNRVAALSKELAAWRAATLKR